LWTDGAKGESLQFVKPGPETALFTSAFNVEAVLLNPVNFCDGQDNGSGGLDLLGTYDHGKVTLYAKGSATKATCVEGQFASQIRLAATATGARPARGYVNSRVDVQLSLGIWTDSGATKLKFADSADTVDNNSSVQVLACDVSAPGASVLLDGTLFGFVTNSDKKPIIDVLIPQGQATARYTQVEFTDGMTLTLKNAAGQTVVLHRVAESSATICQ